MKSARQPAQDDWYNFFIDPEHFQFKKELPSFARLYGNDPGELVGKLMRQLYDEVIAPGYQDKIDAIIKRKKLSINAVTSDPEINQIIDVREKEFKRLEQALFDALLSRGMGPPQKVTTAAIKGAFEALGAKATQAEIADHLNVHRRSLQRWASENHFQSWEEVKAHFNL